MQVFEAMALQSFLEASAKHIRSRLPGCCLQLSEPALVQLLEKAFEEASAFGVDQREDLVPFFDLVAAHGLAFSTTPNLSWAAPLLADPALSGDVKIAFLYERLPLRLHPSTISQMAPPK